MTQNLEYYTKVKDRLIERDGDRNRQWAAYDRMWHNEWALPVEVQDLGWVREAISSDPHDAIAAGDRTLSTLDPKVKITPLDDTAETSEAVNRIERNLQWQLKSANNGRSVSIQSDVVRSALLYMATAVVVTDIDWQIKLVEQEGGDTTQLKEARKQSRFSITSYHPSDVHTSRNRYGTYAVLLHQMIRAEEIAYEWGVQGSSKWKELIEENGEVELFDYYDLKDRVVWAEAKSGSEPLELFRGPHELGFIPWVAIMGGSDLEGRESDKYHPLLYSVAKTKQWETQNIIQSLYVSETIAKASQPDFAEEGSNPDNAVIDYTDPTRHAKVPPGNTLKPLPKQGIPAGMAEVNAQLANAISKSTVSQVLLGGQLPAGTAFSTVNTVTQTALAALNPAKKLAEATIAKIFVAMVKWVNYTNMPLIGYGSSKDDAGMNYVLEPGEIDEESLYLQVHLTADVPTDRLQRANAANLMKNLGYPKWKSLEELGSEDPDQDIYDSYLEQYIEAQFQNALERQRMEQQYALQLQFEQARMTLQMQVQAAQQGQQMQVQQQQQQAQAQAMAQQRQMEQQAMAQQQAQELQSEGQGPFPGGQGYNPNMGGMATAGAFPEATREQVTGEDMGGNPLAELGGGMA